MSFSRSLVWLLIFSIVGPLRAGAEPENKAAAREHFDKGVAAFAERRFGDAATEFDAAYRLSPAFVVLYNIGQVDVALGRSVEAVDAFEKYLRQGASSISAERRREVSAEIEKQSANIGAILVRTVPEGAEVRIDGVLAGNTPLSGPVRVNAGRHTVEAILVGHAAKVRETDVRGRAEVAIELTLEPAVTIAPPAPPPQVAPPAPAPAPSSPMAQASLVGDKPPETHVIEKSVVERVIEKPATDVERAPAPSSAISWQRLTGVVVTVGGLVAVTAGGLIAYGGANAAKDSLDRFGPGLMGQAYDDELARFNAAKSRNQRGWTIVGVGAAVVVGGVLLIATAPEKRNTVGITPSVWTSAQSGGVSMTGVW